MPDLSLALGAVFLGLTEICENQVDEYHEYQMRFGHKSLNDGFVSRSSEISTLSTQRKLTSMRFAFGFWYENKRLRWVSDILC